MQFKAVHRPLTAQFTPLRRASQQPGRRYGTTSTFAAVMDTMVHLCEAQGDENAGVSRQTYMLAVVPRVIRSDLRVEIEVVAAVAPGSATTDQDA